MKGWGKIKGCCEQSKQDGWKWAWVDSCCIDKTSSAELSEAINSMFSWYKRAEICYVYLPDVSQNQTRSGSHGRSEFERSKWFTRGWTLQELLAPRWVEFYTSSWNHIGTKSSLTPEIFRATGINDRHLFDYEDACIAQKMCWASKRETTRIEDEAYCLMGLFNVYMPPLYGEGQHAFYRLQLEILKHSDDESIFAWGVGDSKGAETQEYGLLAPSPYGFAESAHTRRSDMDKTRPPMVLTNKGLKIETFLTGSSSADDPLLKGRGKSKIPRGPPPPEPVSHTFERYFLCMVLNCKDYSPGKTGSPQAGAFIQVSLNIPQPHGQHHLNREGEEILNALKGWSRNGKLDISSISPLKYKIFSPHTRLLLFVETVSNLDRNSSIHTPEHFQVETPLGFPYKNSSAHQILHQRNSVTYWKDITSPNSTNKFPATGDIALMFRRTGELFLETFTLYITTKFEVFILPRINKIDHLESKITDAFVGEKIQPTRRRDATSILLADGVHVHATHKKEIVDEKYTFVIRLSHIMVRQMKDEPPVGTLTERNCGT